MASYDFLFLVLKDIQRRKFSSFLTLFAISLGILAIYVIVLVSAGFEDTIKGSLDELGGNKIFITPIEAGALGDNELQLIENKPYIKQAFPFYNERTTVQFGKEFRVRTITGANPTDEFFQSFNQEIEIGRALRQNERFGAVIGPRFAEDAFDKEVKVGSNLIINNTKFKVVGIFESFGNAADDNIIMVNIDILQELFNRDDEISLVQADVVDGANVTLARENLKIALENRVGEDKIDIRTADQFLAQFQEILTIVNATLGGIAFVALLVGTFGIINTMYVIVTEKTKDIGIMKAIGAKNSEILILYMFQAGTFGFLGALLGLILGSFVALGFGALSGELGFDLTITIDPWVFLGLLVFGFLIGAFSGFLPALQASKLEVVDSLRK